MTAEERYVVNKQKGGKHIKSFIKKIVDCHSQKIWNFRLWQVNMLYL